MYLIPITHYVIDETDRNIYRHSFHLFNSSVNLSTIKSVETFYAHNVA